MWHPSCPCPLRISPRLLAEVRALGIKSIVWLLADDQLPLYSQLPTDFVSYYRNAEFSVKHVPAQDCRKPPLSQDQRERVAVGKAATNTAIATVDATLWRCGSVLNGASGFRLSTCWFISVAKLRPFLSSEASGILLPIQTRRNQRAAVMLQ